MESDVVDIIVIGCGAGGIAAALAARKAGADVVIVEHQPAENHTPNVRMSGGWVMTFEGDAGTAATYLTQCACGMVEPETLEIWAERGLSLEGWLESVGVRLERSQNAGHDGAEQRHLEGASSVRVGRARSMVPSPHGGPTALMRDDKSIGGEAVYRGLMKGIKDAAIPVLWNVKPTRLLRDGDRITGVEIIENGRKRSLTARRGVVIATGGFGGNPAMAREFLSVPNTRFYGSPANDGSGMKLAMAAGADLVRMNRMVGRAVFSPPPADNPIAFMIDLSGGGYLICDQLGKRYANEYEQEIQSHSFYYKMQHFDAEHGAYTRSPSYYFFDERRMRAGPITFTERGACGVGLYDWSPDNHKEVEQGWIGRGATPSEAAAKVGAPDVDFDAEVARYNETCKSGNDPFGRPRDSLMPLETPYYCMPLVIGGPYAHGGPRRDHLGRLIDAASGEPIPGLYGAGEAGQAIGLLYPAAGASISEALCLGAVAGEAAATNL